MKRVFFALWPSDNTRQHIHSLNQKIDLESGVKHQPDNLHVTLLFLGNIDEAIEAEMIKQAGRITKSAFSICFDRLEYWEKPKVLCLTASRQEKALHELVNTLTDLAKKLYLPIEESPYHAHITLARKVKSAHLFSFDSFVWKANDFALVESCSTPQGVKYKVIASWSLLN